MEHFTLQLIFGIAIGGVVVIPAVFSPLRKAALYNQTLRRRVMLVLAIVSASAAFVYSAEMVPWLAAPEPLVARVPGLFVGSALAAYSSCYVFSRFTATRKPKTLINA